MTLFVMVADHLPRIEADARRCDHISSNGTWCGLLQEEHWSDPVEVDDEGTDPCARCHVPYDWHGDIEHPYITEEA